MKSVLLISNTKPNVPGGRGEKLATRKRLLREHEWEIVIGYVPEPYFLLFPFAILSCLYKGFKEDVDVVNSISNPFHLQVVGYIVSVLLRVPWLVEFRDPMVVNPDRDPDAFLTKVAARVEKLSVHKSEKVVWVDGIQMEEDYFQKKYPKIPSEKFYKLPFLGFEKEKFESAPVKEYDSFTLTYAGSFYEGWIEPYDLLKGLSVCVECNEVTQDELTLQFYGDWDKKYQKKTEELGLSDFVKTHDFVPHEEIIPVLKGSDIVVYIGGNDTQNEVNVPSKIWDYIGAKTPILAVVDPSFRVARLIEENGLGIAVYPENTECVADGIECMHSGEFEYAPNEMVFEEFSRAHQIDVLADVLDSLTIDNVPSH